MRVIARSTIYPNKQPNFEAIILPTQCKTSQNQTGFEVLTVLKFRRQPSSFQKNVPRLGYYVLASMTAKDQCYRDRISGLTFACIAARRRHDVAQVQVLEDAGSSSLTKQSLKKSDFAWSGAGIYESLGTYGVQRCSIDRTTWSRNTPMARWTSASDAHVQVLHCVATPSYLSSLSDKQSLQLSDKADCNAVSKFTLAPRTYFLDLRV